MFYKKNIDSEAANYQIIINLLNIQQKKAISKLIKEYVIKKKAKFSKTHLFQHKTSNCRHIKGK